MNTNAKIQIIRPVGGSEGPSTPFDVTIIDNYVISGQRLSTADQHMVYDDLAESITEYNSGLIGYSAQTSELEIPQKEILQILVRIAAASDEQRFFLFKDVPIWTDPADQQNQIVGNLTSTGFEFYGKGGAYFTRQFMLDHGLQNESELNISIFAATAK